MRYPVGVCRDSWLDTGERAKGRRRRTGTLCRTSYAFLMFVVDFSLLDTCRHVASFSWSRTPHTFKTGNGRGCTHGPACRSHSIIDLASLQSWDKARWVFSTPGSQSRGSKHGDMFSESQQTFYSAESQGKRCTPTVDSFTTK